QSLRPAKIGAVEQLPRSFQYSRVQRLLHGAGSLDTQRLQSCGCVWRCNVTCPFAAADSRIDLERSGRGDQLAIILDQFQPPYQRGRTRFLHEQFRECGGLEKIEAHSSPRSTSIASAAASPCTATGWKRCASSGIPASARFSRMVVVG